MVVCTGSVVRQSQGHDLAAIAATGEVLEHDRAFEVGQRTLGEGRQQIRVGMIDGGRRGLQAIAHDFGDILHFSF